MRKIKELFQDWKYVRICLYIVATAVLLYILYLVIGNLGHILKVAVTILQSIFSAFSPLIIGIIIAYLLSPFVDMIDKKVVSKLITKLPDDPIKLEKWLGLRRTISVLIAFLLVFLFIFIILYAFAVLIVGDLFFTSLHSMVDSIVAYFSRFEFALGEGAQNLPPSIIEEGLHDVVNTGINWVNKKITSSNLIPFLSKLGGSLFNLFIGIVASIYLLKDKDFFIRLCRKALHLILPMKVHGKTREALSDINIVVSQFIRGQLLAALTVAIMSSIGFTLIGLEFAVFIGCFGGLLNIIPYFGPVISAIAAAIVGFLTDGISQGLLAIIVVIVVQQIDSNITFPRIVGSTIGLHPLFILISVVVGGYYGGLLGMIIAVPIAAIIKVLLVKIVKNIN
ncbi:MAG: AI-2E family transporter [Anaerovoracaceae bacterium]|jgi:predicted PurR-regulated permease PerM